MLPFYQAPQTMLNAAILEHLRSLFSSRSTKKNKKKDPHLLDLLTSNSEHTPEKHAIISSQTSGNFIGNRTKYPTELTMSPEYLKGVHAFQICNIPEEKH